MDGKYKKETFGLGWYISEAKHETVYFVLKAMMAFNHAVREKMAGTEFDKTLTKARLSIALGEKKKRKIKKGYGVRSLFKRESEYRVREANLIDIGQQKLSEVVSEKEKQQIIDKYGKLCADNWLKTLNIAALIQSKTIPNTSYIEQRDQWFKSNKEDFIPTFFLNGAVFKRSPN